jgi:hypothetical protein
MGEDMSATPNCKPWCTDHQDSGMSECYTRFVIYDDGMEAKAAPAPGSMAAKLRALGGLPAEISWIAFVASQDEEDEHPIMNLQFFEAGDDVEQNSDLSVELDGLKELHANLGAILKKFS